MEGRYVSGVVPYLNCQSSKGVVSQDIETLKEEIADLRYQLQVHKDVAEMRYNYIIKSVHSLEKQNKE